MINEETNLTGGEDEVLLPLETAATNSEKAQQPAVEIPIGHVLIIALDGNGAEIPGSEFFYPERSYQRFYADESKFNVKKKL
ncbi:hypothetical protein [Polluticoccus soli]|uniref:hypothetical protein n=1 Tax=Polluticoccus soli TaxID=3034150 RepID=UPI0023E11FCD|nr:hypothetical protein [Flavipsychrobacter sp. JY13-12]